MIFDYAEEIAHNGLENEREEKRVAPLGSLNGCFD